MTPLEPAKKLDDVLDQLDEESEQEEASTKEGSSIFASIDAEVFRERDREYRDREKHWVRRESWLRILKELAHQKRRGLRYLTLPSSYRLDVSLFLRENLLEKEVADDGVSVRAVSVAAFENDPWKYGLMVGQSPQFQLFGRCAIEDAILDHTNDYYSQLLALFPFDVVNLDLTTSLTPRHEGPFSKIMQAIEVVLRRQVDCIGRWALFLTVRNVPEDWEEGALKQLLANLQSNLARHPKAQQAFFKIYEKVDVEQLHSSDRKSCISQSVVKWLVDNANRFGIHLESLNCYKYDRYNIGLEPYMISKYVFVFSKARISTIRLPAKEVPRQAWMDDDVVTSIEKHKLLDVEAKLVQLSKRVPSVFDDLDRDIQELCDMLTT